MIGLSPAWEKAAKRLHQTDYFNEARVALSGTTAPRLRATGRTDSGRSAAGEQPIIDAGQRDNFGQENQPEKGRD